MTALKNDRALRFYSDVLGLERLHYGFWQPEEPLNFENLKAAQIRYEQLLIDQLPTGTESVLDVGCGTGVMSASLKKMGYLVEGVSPDINQKQPYLDKVGTQFHQVCFEDFKPAKVYDAVMMSESCQYIPLNQLFERVKQTLADDGVWVVCDYFPHTGATGKLAKSGHNIDEFLRLAESHGFELTQQQDITDNITPTLELGKDFVNRCLIAADLGLEKAKTKHPLLLKILHRFFGKKINKAKTELDLLDAEAFKRAKSYQLLVYKKR